jgi:signal transduction histidine kinase
MKTIARRFAAAMLTLLGAIPPAQAALTGVGIVPPGLALAVAWLALLGWGFHALLRRRLAFSDRLAAAETELDAERQARQRAERALGDTHGALCKLVRQQEAVRETERNRIARDIHDDLGQNLLALKMELTRMEADTNDSPPARHEKLQYMVRNLDLSILSLRTVINDLRPLALEHGLLNAVQWQLQEFSRVSGIAHELKADPAAFDANADAPLEAMLFRILQESLSNVARHAQASTVTVALRREPDCLRLAVRDNGVGMVGPPAGRGCGLPGMRDRVAALGGSFAIDSAPGAGTCLSLMFPLPAPAPANCH